MKKNVAYMHTHIHTMEYYLTIKKNEIMPSVRTWMGLEIIGQSKPETERQIPYDIAYMWNLPKKDTTELI